jgi:hypothetical protein
MYYYASRNDKAGNYLVTSYGNKTSQKKYGGADARTFDGFRVFNPGSSTFREVTDDAIEDGEVVVRSYMKSPAGAQSTSSGKFVLLAKDSEGWKETSFRASSYGAANTLMKALISVYGEMMIIEEDADTSGAASLGDENVPF